MPTFDPSFTPSHAFLDLLLCHKDQARKLEQQELEATYTDAWAVGGSAESDCVCRGGRCPRMWDCPFWVDRRRAEAKGSSAHVRIVASENISWASNIRSDLSLSMGV